MKRNRRQKKARQSRNPDNIGGPNTCKVIETVPTTQVNLNTGYLQFKAGITGVRAPVIAQTFGLYRIAKIMFTYRPLCDTYASGIAGVGNFAVQVPTLYWKMNRYGDIPAVIDGNYMRALGAKPMRLDDKNVSFSYVPNVLQSQQNTAGAATASIVKGPWLSTDDLVNDQNFTLSTALHYGHSLFVEAAGAGNAQGPVANLDIKVVYEFKQPRVIRATGAIDPNAAPVVTLAV